MGNWHINKYLDGQMYKRENFKPKYSWIAKANSDGTPDCFPISCPDCLQLSSFGYFVTGFLKRVEGSTIYVPTNMFNPHVHIHKCV